MERALQIAINCGKTAEHSAHNPPQAPGDTTSGRVADGCPLLRATWSDGSLKGCENTAPKCEGKIAGKWELADHCPPPPPRLAGQAPGCLDSSPLTRVHMGPADQPSLAPPPPPVDPDRPSPPPPLGGWAASLRCACHARAGAWPRGTSPPPAQGPHLHVQKGQAIPLFPEMLCREDKGVCGMSTRGTGGGGDVCGGGTGPRPPDDICVGGGGDQRNTGDCNTDRFGGGPWAPWPPLQVPGARGLGDVAVGGRWADGMGWGGPM